MSTKKGFWYNLKSKALTALNWLGSGFGANDWSSYDGEEHKGWLFGDGTPADVLEDTVGDILGTSQEGKSNSLFGTPGFWNALTSYLNSKTGASLTGAQREQNTFNAEQAAIDRGFQERMSNTAYQRGVVDMQNAGLNPALMYGSGSAAVTPSGAVASGGSPGVNGEFGIMSLLMQTRLKEKELKTSKEIADDKNKTEKEVAEIGAGVGHESNEISRLQYELAAKELEMREYLTSAQVDEINQRISDYQSKISSREVSSMLDKAMILLTHARTDEIHKLVPARLGLMRSESENLDADTALKSEEQFIKHELIKRGYIDKQIDQLDKSIEGLELSNKQKEAIVKLKNRLYDIKTGKPFHEDSGDWYKDVPAKVLNAVFGEVVEGIDAFGSAVISSLAK